MEFKSFSSFIEILEILKVESKNSDAIDLINKNLDKFKNDEEVSTLYCYLGIFFAGENNETEALLWLNKVDKTKSKNQYSRSQINIGILYFQNSRFEDAIRKWDEIIESDSEKEYQRVKYWKAKYCLEKKEEKEKAKDLLLTIDPLLYPKYYALANLLLSQMFSDDNKKYISYLKKIKRKHNNDVYAEAQIKLFFATKEIKFLKNVKENDNDESFSKANYILGWLSNDSNEKSMYLEKIIDTSNFFLINRYEIKLLRKISKLENETFQIKSFKILHVIQEILKNLFISSDYEKLIAHYTNLSVSKLLLSKNKDTDFNMRSLLRLNTINLMNDPGEGVLINELLYLKDNVITNDLAFIACFTLHHDSLNQFRLYSKENKNEALGVSLVLGREFFSKFHDIACISDNVKVNIENHIKNETNHSSKLATMPLYRCIYFDPTSGLIKVAQREEWSFKREFKIEGKHNWFDENIDADKRWGKYNEEITQIEIEVKSGLEQLAKLIKELEIDNISFDEQELLAEILLPLRYLMKHMAFKEEQECRIVYVTQMDNPLIQYDDKINRIYINYEPSVMEYLEKIYIAPKAKGEKMVFEYLCSRGQDERLGKEPVRVKISQNPFR